MNTGISNFFAKIDKFYIGAIISVVIAVLAFVIQFEWRYNGQLGQIAYAHPALMMPLVQLSGIPLVGVFFLFLQFNANRAAKGSILGLILLGLVAVYLSFVK